MVPINVHRQFLFELHWQASPGNPLGCSVSVQYGLLPEIMPRRPYVNFPQISLEYIATLRSGIQLPILSGFPQQINPKISSTIIIQKCFSNCITNF